MKTKHNRSNFNKDNIDKNMETDCVIHFKDKVPIEEKRRKFTEVTFTKF